LAHVLVGAGWGGAERLACALARRLEHAGHELAMEATPDCRPGARGEPLASLRGRPARWLAWALAARRRLRAFDPHVVHLHLSTPAFAAAAACIAAGRPSVWTFHLLPASSWPLDAMTRLPCAWTLGIVGKTSPARFVGVSETDMATLAARFGPGVVRCVVNAPPPAPPEPEPIDGAAWGDAVHRLVFVGRLEAQKGVDRLLRGLAAPDLAATPFRLLVVGDGPARTELEELAADLGLSSRVRFAGARPGTSAMRAADLVVCPSRYEGMPLVPMEAILAGTAVVASPIAPHRELLGKVTGSLLPEDDGAWGAWLCDRLGDPTGARALVAAQALLAPRFSLDRVVAEYGALYEEVAASRTGCSSFRQPFQSARVARLSLSSTARAKP
jgi:glycosyltransferase involved in cell wall biosynthesis